ncbi:hypothetical protein DENSPDRAFT_80574 [Dentipellis sp. KUC8613]|nr:hypothetical protein DENSPDRAFT_80574 [Dentipellis sp. KUC8613]
MAIAIDLSLDAEPNPTPHYKPLDFILNEIKLKNSEPRHHGYQFTATSCLSDTDAVKVYRGDLIRLPERTVIDAVCKLAYSKRATDKLAHEAIFYVEQLHDLQGMHVPRFYGHFSEKRQGVACVVLGYGGKPVAMDGSRLSAVVDREFASAIVKAAIAIHDAGLRHGRLDGCHILNNNGRPMIIGFSKARKHDCMRLMCIADGQSAPKVINEHCDELHDLFFASRIRKLRKRSTGADEAAARARTRELGLSAERPPKAQSSARFGDSVQKQVSALLSKVGMRGGSRGYQLLAEDKA